MESHTIFIHINKPVIGDSDLVCIPSQVFHYCLRRGKGLLGIDYPFGREDLFGDVLWQVDLFSQRRHKLCTKDDTERSFGKEVLLAVLASLPFSRRCYATTRDDAMYMRVPPQLLTPSVQDSYHTGFSPQIFGVGSEYLYGLPTCREQGLVNLLIMSGEQLIELMWESKDHMIVRNGQQFAFPIYDPAFTIGCLTFGAVSVAA